MNNVQDRIQLNDTIMDIAMKLSDGNPGAIHVILEIVREADSIDPDLVLGYVGYLMMLDTNRCYGSDIWIFYNDICHQNISTMLALQRACQLGLIDKKIVSNVIQAVHAGNPSKLTPLEISEYISSVKKRLPAFRIKL